MNTLLVIFHAVETFIVSDMKVPREQCESKSAPDYNKVSLLIIIFPEKEKEKKRIFGCP